MATICRIALIASAILLGGCVAYAPRPLPPASEILGAELPSTAATVNSPAHELIPSHPVDLDSPLSDLDAARLALIASPDLAAIRARSGVAQAQLFASGLLPDPQISLAADWPKGAGLFTALSTGVSFDIASLFTHRTRVVEAERNLEKTRLDIAWTEWLVFNQVRTLARRSQSLKKQVEVVNQAASLAQALHERAGKSLKAGDARLDEATVYQIGFLDAENRSLDLHRQQVATDMQLNALIGVPADARLNLADLPNPVPASIPDTPTLVADAMAHRLDLKALRAGYLAQERGVRLAVLGQIPLPQLNLSRVRDTSNVHTQGLGLSMNIPLWNRNRGAIEIASATREQLSSEYRARVFQARSDIVSAAADLQAIDRQRQVLAEQVPQLEHSAEVILQATQEGSLPLLTYETVRASLLDKRLALLSLEQARLEVEVALETAAAKLIWETP